jgi:nucleotide-binding universal stress UspA family protein
MRVSPDAARSADLDPVGMGVRPRRIVVGYDGSDEAARALDAAADLTGYGSTLTVVAVGSDDPPGSTMKAARERLLRRQVAARYFGIAGEPAGALLGKARELGADLVVVGHRNGGTGSQAVVRDATCDVLVVR